MNEPVKILCVDDEKSVLRALQRLLLDSDYEIITSGSGSEGIDILKEEKDIQLVISDYRMPMMNGVDFLKEEYQLRPETVRIVLSGYADTASIVEAINEGKIYKFIPKPWDDNDLKITIDKALEHYFERQKNIRLTRELETKNAELVSINNNLERIVAERTEDIMMKNKVLTSSQNILDSLPVGVIGIDLNGLIVQCNKKGTAWLNPDNISCIGTDRQDSLPSDLNDIIEDIIGQKEINTVYSCNGRQLELKGTYMHYPSGQEGIILVLVNGVTVHECN